MALRFLLAAVLCALITQLYAQYTACNCGASYYSDSQCTTSFYPTTSYEFSGRCINNMMPLGSWASYKNETTGLPVGAVGLSYKFKNCISPYGSTQIVNTSATMALVQFQMWNTTGCPSTATSTQSFPPDGSSCLPIWVFSDLMYAKFVCTVSA